MQKRIGIDEEGYFILNEGARMNDAEYGLSLLKNLHVDDNFTMWTTSPPHDRVIVEAFDKPLVVHNVEALGTKIIALFPYGFRSELLLETLCLDDWGRLVGWTAQKIPYVFLRKAQTAFFDTVAVESAHTFTWQNHKYTLSSYYLPLEEAHKTAFWEDRYKIHDMPWDLGGPHPAIEPILPQLKLQKSRFLNLGCGRGHDAALLARKGHIVTGIDISEKAISEAKTLYPKPQNLRFKVDDIFRLSEPQKTDVIFEHTLFCAIDPRQRKELIRVWKNCLEDTGYLLGIFFVHAKRFGPPYGCSEWELRELLEPHFRLMYWKRWEASPERRQGNELVVFAQKL